MAMIQRLELARKVFAVNEADPTHQLVVKLNVSEQRMMKSTTTTKNQFKMHHYIFII